MAARQQTVMVIDDDDGVRHLLSVQLRAEGYRVVTARDGETALDLLSRRSVDLIVVDLVMPGKDGVQTITNVRVTHPNIHIVAISGDINSAVYLHAAEHLGVKARLQKPFTLEQLRQAIATALS